MNRKSRSWFFTGVNCHLECFYLVQLCQISSLVGPTIASLLETGQMSQNWRMEVRVSSSRDRWGSRGSALAGSFLGQSFIQFAET